MYSEVNDGLEDVEALILKPILAIEMDLELREQVLPKTQAAPRDKEEMAIMSDGDNQDSPVDERMGLLDPADKALSTTDVENVSLPDIFQACLLVPFFSHHLIWMRQVRMELVPFLLPNEIAHVQEMKVQGRLAVPLAANLLLIRCSTTLKEN